MLKENHVNLYLTKHTLKALLSSAITNFFLLYFFFNSVEGSLLVLVAVSFNLNIVRNISYYLRLIYWSVIHL